MCSIQAKIRGEDTERQEGTPLPPRCSPLHGRPHAWCTPTRPAYSAHMYSSQVNTFSVERERTERRDAGRRGRPHAWGAPSQPCGRGGSTKRPFEFPIRPAIVHTSRFLFIMCGFSWCSRIR